MKLAMHTADRHRLILKILSERGYIGLDELGQHVEASSATLRRDLSRLGKSGEIVRFRGGAMLARSELPLAARLTGAPTRDNAVINLPVKKSIGRAASGLCREGESVMIAGGTTTLQMCPYLEALSLHVVTNSLQIVSALLAHEHTRISVPAGTLFRRQNVLLCPFDDDGLDRYYAAKLFMGAASVGRHGLMQTDVMLTQADRRMIEHADELIVVVDSSKFDAAAGYVVCPLEEIDTLVTDERIGDDDAKMVEESGIRLIIVPLDDEK